MKNAVTTSPDIFLTEAKRGLYELCWQTIKGKLRSEQVKETLRENLVRYYI